MTDFAVDYDHSGSLAHHSLGGAKSAFSILYPEGSPQTVLDVGCGIGTWLRAALDHGAREVVGIDGVDLSPELLLVPREAMRVVNLNEPLSLGRRFNLVICLEVVEHLEPDNADVIVETLIRHGNSILFSAAAPGQSGIHHVNCQWPSYWQRKFNERGYECSDDVRWKLWNSRAIEPWYRQNIMTAWKSPSAGQEPRINSVIHPEFLHGFADSLQFGLRESFRRAVQRRLPFKNERP
jgi:SAM-dependent methyltransferase